jgi:hypothetical protein
LSAEEVWENYKKAWSGYEKEIQAFKTSASIE